MRTRVLRSMGLISVAGAILISTTAFASPSVSTSATQAPSSSFCTAVPDGQGQPTNKSICFGHENSVDAYLTEQGIRIQAPSAQSRTTAASVVLGRAYQDTNLRGASFTYYGSSGCAGATFGFSPLASGWTNTISSAQGTNGCWLTLYSATGFGGDRQNCTPTCTSVLRFNDAVKSIVFRPTGQLG